MRRVLRDFQVDAIVPVMPGRIYSTSSVDWKGNSAITISEVAPFIHMPLGQPVDAVRLLRDLENVGKLYRSRGYMTVQIKPDAQFDDEQKHRALRPEHRRRRPLQDGRVGDHGTRHAGQGSDAGSMDICVKVSPTTPTTPRNLWTIPGNSFPAACRGPSAFMNRWMRRTRPWTWRSVSSSSSVENCGMLTTKYFCNSKLA